MSKVQPANGSGDPTGARTFAIDPTDLSDIMDPKADKSKFDAVGGSVEAIAKALRVDLTTGLSGEQADLDARMAQFGG
jgi:hypothetical protein